LVNDLHLLFFLAKLLRKITSPIYIYTHTHTSFRTFTTHGRKKERVNRTAYRGGDKKASVD